MMIEQKTQGEYIPYSLSKNSLTLNDELTIKLDKYERDEPAHIDVCLDRFGNLVMGVIPNVAERYAAQIDIPERKYETLTDGIDSDGNQIDSRVPVPFDPKTVKLTLWGLEGV